MNHYRCLFLDLFIRVICGHEIMPITPYRSNHRHKKSIDVRGGEFSIRKDNGYSPNLSRRCSKNSTNIQNYELVSSETKKRNERIYQRISLCVWYGSVEDY